MHARTLIKMSHIQVRSRSDSECYPGQWVIRVSDADPVLTLMHTTIITIIKCQCITVKLICFYKSKACNLALSTGKKH